MKLLKKINRKLNKISTKILEEIKPFIRKRNYLGFDLYYSKGTSIIESIKQKGSIYEPVTCSVILEAIKDIEKPCIVDVGANIGLISLYIVKHKSDVKIYAFEPGPHQNSLLGKTINKNNLNDTINLYDVALGAETGTATFCIHNTRDVSGDGFKDTGRAGEYKEITVKTSTLDAWWTNAGKPNINLIKCDTEGAELFVFQGALKVIKTCRPLLFFEMYPENYNKYNYSHNDIFSLLEDKNYTLYSDEGTLITRNNIQEMINNFHNYVAKHITSIKT